MKMTYKEEWADYYQFLENLRQSGVVNMYGATPYLRNYISSDWRSDSIHRQPKLTKMPDAEKVLLSWMEHYDTLIADGIIDRDDNWGRGEA